MQRQEIANNTDAQVVEYVTRARELADQLNLSTEQWCAVFTAACELYSGKQILMVQPQPVDLAQFGITSNGLRA